MIRRTPFAVARAQPIRPAFRLPYVRFSGRRVLAVAAAVLAVAALLYVGARETSLFAVREIAVTGASPRVEREVRAVLEDADGRSLVDVDRVALERRLDALPSVRSVDVDRSFPHALRVDVVPEKPLAVLRTKSGSWIVSRRGVVVREVGRRAQRRLPAVAAAADGTARPGETVADPATNDVLQALAAVPDAFPARVATARSTARGIRFTLRHGTQLRLGPPDGIRAKIAAATAVLAALRPDERRSLAYLDVSLPERPVGRENTQLEGDG